MAACVACDGRVLSRGEGGSLEATSPSPAAFLRAWPRGAYTAARTWRQRGVLQWDLHLRRLLDSAATIQADAAADAAKGGAAATARAAGNGEPSVPSALPDTPAAVDALVRPTLRAALAAAGALGRALASADASTIGCAGASASTEASAAPASEFLVIVLLFRQRHHMPPSGTAPSVAPLCCAAHVTPLPGGLGPPHWAACVARVAGRPRAWPAAKDSDWATERLPLEALRPEGPLNEVILARPMGDTPADAAGVAAAGVSSSSGAGAPSGISDPTIEYELYEGLTTNLFVVLQAANAGEGGRAAQGSCAGSSAPLEVHTAPVVTGPGVDAAGCGVLGGTARTAVLSACARLGIPVVLRPPSTADVGRWREAFVTSVTRRVQPLTALLPPDGPAPRWPLPAPFPGPLTARLQAYLSEEEAATEGWLPDAWAPTEAEVAVGGAS